MTHRKKVATLDNKAIECLLLTKEGGINGKEEVIHAKDTGSFEA